MDRRAPTPPVQRDLMFCHSCQDEWYRDEHGLTCPQCGGEFCEIVESTNDPRALLHLPQEHDDVPDPDEEDIDQFGWQGNDEPERFRARFERTNSQGTPQRQQGGGLMGLLGSAFRLAGDMIQPPNAEQNASRSPSDTHSTVERTVSPNGTTFTRHTQGNGYTLTMTTTSASNVFPRDPHNAQPFQHQPQDINEIMQQMLSNIGAFSPGAHGPRGAPRPPWARSPWDPDLEGHDSGFDHGHPPFPAGLFQFLGLPVGGVHGDAVYSQEGLDRIISQLMEQHQSGHAPGPASQSAIRSLPKRPITEKDLGDSGTAECSICMDSVALGDEVTVLPCEHWFHYDCIEAWLKEHDTCPQCRQGIMPKDNVNANTARSPSQAPLNDMSSSENTRTHVPGAYPFPQQGSSSSRSRGSGQHRNIFDSMRGAFHDANASNDRAP